MFAYSLSYKNQPRRLALSTRIILEISNTLSLNQFYFFTWGFSFAEMLNNEIQEEDIR